MMHLILIGGFWINPGVVSSLSNQYGGCIISFAADTSDLFIKNSSCNDVAKKINQAIDNARKTGTPITLPLTALHPAQDH